MLGTQGRPSRAQLNAERVQPGRRATSPTFLEYAGEPAALKRQSLGVWVILFLAAFTLIAYLLKLEYWRDVDKH